MKSRSQCRLSDLKALASFVYQALTEFFCLLTLADQVTMTVAQHARARVNWGAWPTN